MSTESYAVICAALRDELRHLRPTAPPQPERELVWVHGTVAAIYRERSRYYAEFRRERSVTFRTKHEAQAWLSGRAGLGTAAPLWTQAPTRASTEEK